MNNISETNLFSQFAHLMNNNVGIGDLKKLDGRLLLAKEEDLEVYYAPFDYVETQARVVLVGITPGLVQARNALSEASRQLAAGASLEQAMYRAKLSASFSGPMRNNLIRLLDDVGLNNWLGLRSTSLLFDDCSHLVHYTSTLRYPVFYRGENYSGNPHPEKSPMLLKQIEDWFAREVKQLSDAIFIPLGALPKRILLGMAKQSWISPNRILDGLPHPSGANAERIAYFLGNKTAAECSPKCDPKRLDEAKRNLIRQIALLSSESTC